MKLCAHSIFHGTPTQRIALARERFFEQAQRPTGLTSEAVIQSWGRCLGRHREAGEAVQFDPVTHSRSQLAIQRNCDLIAAWSVELQHLQAVLKSTTCSAVLTDASGIVISATPFQRSHERLMPIAHRVGVNLSEEAIGTTAPGLTAKTGRMATVTAGEHYFDAVRSMSCAAAPIRDVAGRLAGVLDISSEGVPFGFDASALVAQYAETIENRLLVSQSTGLLVLRFAGHPALLDSTDAGLAAVDAAGRMVWASRRGVGLLGIDAPDRSESAPDAEAVFDVRLARLASVPRLEPHLIDLPNGLSVWVRAESPPWQGEQRADGKASHPAGADAEASPAAGADGEASPGVGTDVDRRGGSSAWVTLEAGNDAGLRDCDRTLISRVLSDCGGNVSSAAKRLRVSRGLIYRRMKS